MCFRNKEKPMILQNLVNVRICMLYRMAPYIYVNYPDYTKVNVYIMLAEQGYF